MKERIFGIKKNQVDRALKNLEWEFKSELNQLEYEIQMIEQENENLLQDIERLSKKQQNSIEDDEWKLAKQRVKGIVGTFKRQAEIEKSSLRKESAQRIEEIEQLIEEVDSEISYANQLFGRMVNQISNIADNFDGDIKPKKSKTKSVELTEKELPIENKEKIKTFLIESKEDNHDFWGATKHYMNTEPLEKEEEKSKPDSKTDMEPLEEEEEDFETPNPPNTKTVVKPTQSQESITTTEDNGELTDDKQIPQPSNEKTTDREEVVDDELILQIDAIKSQYIVGKVAGADLYGRAGKLIIAENTKITKKVVELANKEGKLAELIVQMKIAENGED